MYTMESFEASQERGIYTTYYTRIQALVGWFRWRSKEAMLRSRSGAVCKQDNPVIVITIIIISVHFIWGEGGQTRRKQKLLLVKKEWSLILSERERESVGHFCGLNNALILSGFRQYGVVLFLFSSITVVELPYLILMSWEITYVQPNTKP